jgi:hypothetical protein
LLACALSRVEYHPLSPRSCTTAVRPFFATHIAPTCRFLETSLSVCANPCV